MGNNTHCNIIVMLSFTHVQMYMSLTKHVSHSEGGYFKAHLLFPKEYPQRPPKMKFITDIWHPNGEQLKYDQSVSKTRNVMVNHFIV